MIQRSRNSIACFAFCVVVSTSGAILGAQERAAALTEQVFAGQCSGCHGLDGRGGEHGPDIATAETVRALSDSQILGILENGKPAGGMPSFGTVLDKAQIRSLVGYLRILQGKHRNTIVPGNVESGRALFFGEAKCADCHMINGKGGFIGSDLTGFGNGHASAEIRTGILHPDRNSAETSTITIVKTLDGRMFQGLTRNEDNFSLQLQAVDGTFYLFDKANLERVEHTRQSLMPTDYESKLPESKLDDLISYILKASDRAFIGGGEKADR